MGQKVHPIGFRLGGIKTWSSHWYANLKYGEFLREDCKIRQHIEKKYQAAGVAKIDIGRAAKILKISVYSSRPGIIIGKKGAGAESLKSEIMRLCPVKGLEPSINVFEVKKPDRDATLVASNIKQQLERRVSFRRAIKKAMASSMRAGAKGIKIQCSGRLGGAEMSRVERYHEGRVPLHTLRADIDYGTARALTTYGIIGVKVWIYRGDILDKNETPTTKG